MTLQKALHPIDDKDRMCQGKEDFLPSLRIAKMLQYKNKIKKTKKDFFYCSQ